MWNATFLLQVILPIAKEFQFQSASLVFNSTLEDKAAFVSMARKINIPWEFTSHFSQKAPHSLLFGVVADLSCPILGKHLVIFNTQLYLKASNLRRSCHTHLTDGLELYENSFRAKNVSDTFSLTETRQFSSLTSYSGNAEKAEIGLGSTSLCGTKGDSPTSGGFI